MLVACPGCPGSTPSTAVRIPPSLCLLFSTHCIPFIFGSSLPLAMLPSIPLLLHLMICLFVLQPEQHAHREHFTFLWTSSPFITVAVRNKTLTPLPHSPTHSNTHFFHPCYSVVVTTRVLCCWAFCRLAAAEEKGKPGEI